MSNLVKIGFGGGCHWCTEAVFQSLKGVKKVAQGWIASEGESSTFSEAVIVHFDPSKISTSVLIEIHLRTHKSTSDHSMRKKYRSAIYYFNSTQETNIRAIICLFQESGDDQLITQLLPYRHFKPSGVEFQNYYYNNPKKPFCTSFIDPKLKFLLLTFSQYTNQEKLEHLNPNSYESTRKSKELL